MSRTYHNNAKLNIFEILDLEALICAQLELQVNKDDFSQYPEYEDDLRNIVEENKYLIN